MRREEDYKLTLSDTKRGQELMKHKYEEKLATMRHSLISNDQMIQEVCYKKTLNATKLYIKVSAIIRHQNVPITTLYRVHLPHLYRLSWICRMKLLY